MSQPHPPLPKDDAKTIDQAIQKIRFDKIENLYIFKNGKQIRRFRGTKKNVTIAQEFLFELRNAVVVHNHPSGSSFSIEDVRTIVEFNSLKLILVTETATYTVERPVKEWNINFDDETTMHNLNVCYNLALDLIDKLIGKNELTLFEKDKEIFHYIWVIFFQFYEINYQKTTF